MQWTVRRRFSVPESASAVRSANRREASVGGAGDDAPVR